MPFLGNDRFWSIFLFTNRFFFKVSFFFGGPKANLYLLANMASSEFDIINDMDCCLLVGWVRFVGLKLHRPHSLEK